MKRLFVQLGQWILKHKKRLIYGALALFIGQFCFFNLGGIGVENVVYAADEQTSSQDSNGQKVATEKLALAQLFHKLVYVLMYPILIVAGKLVDNSLVYGEIFGFDAVLWQLWVIVRNIANFGLGFIFIFKIFQFLIKGQKGDDIKKLIISTLVAGVGIQASWFIMAALIDVSTIVTYGVGGLPLSVLKEDEESLKYNPYILGNVLYVDGNDMDSYHMYLSNDMFLSKDKKSEAKFISECETFVYKYVAHKEVGDEREVTYETELILAPQMLYYLDDINGVYYSTEKLLCHLGDQVYRFAGLYEGDGTKDSNGLLWADVGNGTEKGKNQDLQDDYKGSIISSITELKNMHWSDVDFYIENGQILQIGNAHDGKIGAGPLGVQYGKDDKMGLDVNNERLGTDSSAGWNLVRLDDILSGNYAGVFSALYGSLLNAGNNLRLGATSDNEGSLYIRLLNTFLSLGHAIAVAIPLIVMVVVFIMRIGVLWMAIALSPLIVLLKVFGFDKSDFMKKGILSHLTIENLIPIIFSPAVVCFAISMSTVLVRIINVVNWDAIETSSLSILGGAITLNIAGMGVSVGKLICSVIGVAITWFLVWAAVEASSLGKTDIVKNVKGLATSTLGSLPVIPVPGKDGVSWVGVNAAKDLPSQVSQQVKNTYGAESNEAVQDIVDPSRVEKRKIESYRSRIGSINPEIGSWIDQKIEIESKNGRKDSWSFNDLRGDKTSIIEAINNISEDDKRSKFGSVSEVTFSDGDGSIVRYEFDKGSNKYVKVKK